MDFMERMQAGSDAAAHRRHRGLTTGKSAAGWDAKRHDPEKGTFERARQTAVHAWNAVRGLAHEGYLRDVFPERYDDVTLDDVVAARIAAELEIPF